MPLAITNHIQCTLYVVDLNMADKMNTARFICQVYLVTYSQVNLNLFPKRQSYREAVAKMLTPSQQSQLQILHNGLADEICMQMVQVTTIWILNWTNVIDWCVSFTLTLIFRACTNPACKNFAWIGVEKTEIVLLNDFRWNPKVNSFISVSISAPELAKIALGTELMLGLHVSPKSKPNHYENCIKDHSRNSHC